LQHNSYFGIGLELIFWNWTGVGFPFLELDWNWNSFFGIETLTRNWIFSFWNWIGIEKNNKELEEQLIGKITTKWRNKDLELKREIGI